MRLIRLSFHADLEDKVVRAIEKVDTIEWSIDDISGKFDKLAEILVDNSDGQELVDKFSHLFGKAKEWRLVVMPVEACLPKTETEDDPERKKKNNDQVMREEMYHGVVKGCELTTNFIVLTVLSAIVAAIGLNLDSVTIVIAAMVIAPLLGPILGFSLATALGDFKLMIKAGKAAAVGFGVGFATALILAQVLDVNLDSRELISRTELSLEITVLALAAGAAAALSMTTGLSSALVGVMVAVAFLPPSVASALYLGVGEYKNATSAAVLLLLNIVCAILSAQLVFLWKGIGPRAWWEQKKAKRAMRLNLAFWGALLLALAVLIVTVFG